MNSDKDNTKTQPKTMTAKDYHKVNPYSFFAQTLVDKHAIGFTIRNNEVSFDQEVPEEVASKFKEFYVLKIRPVLVFHPQYGHFIIMTTEETPVIIWAEITITATASGVESAGIQAKEQKSKTSN